MKTFCLFFLNVKKFLYEVQYFVNKIPFYYEHCVFQYFIGKIGNRFPSLHYGGGYYIGRDFLRITSGLYESYVNLAEFFQFFFELSHKSRI